MTTSTKTRTAAPSSAAKRGAPKAAPKATVPEPRETAPVAGTAPYRAVLRTATRSNGVVDRRVGATRLKGHGFRDHGPAEKGAQKAYYCECGHEEGTSPNLTAARDRHQIHLNAVKNAAPKADNDKS